MINNVIIETYRKNMGLREDLLLTESMIEKHRTLETELVKRILLSDPSSRNQIIRESYDTLFNELPWLVHSRNVVRRRTILFWKLFRYSKLIGKNKKVLEVGCGEGDLIWALSQMGNKCIGSDISEERLWSVLKQNNHNLEWQIMDGVKVNLQDNEFDVVISSNVVEHFHPDDLLEHFLSVHRLLKKGGVYLFDTPNRLTGPHDIREVFGDENVLGMHLKEYTYAELKKELEKAGFEKIRSRLLPVPLPFFESLNLVPTDIKSFSEKIVSLAKAKKIRRFLGKALNISVVFIIAQK